MLTNTWRFAGWRLPEDDAKDRAGAARSEARTCAAWPGGARRLISQEPDSAVRVPDPTVLTHRQSNPEGVSGASEIAEPAAVRYPGDGGSPTPRGMRDLEFALRRTVRSTRERAGVR